MQTRIKPLWTARFSRYAIGSALMIIGTVLALTNPSQQDYTDFATRKASALLLQELCHPTQGVSKVLQQLLDEGCSALVKSGGAEIKEFLTYNTERQNFIFFSLYTTELPIHSIRTLGILRNFYVMTSI